MWVVWMWLSYVPCKWKVTIHWSLGFGDYLWLHLIPVPHIPIPFWLIPFFFLSIFWISHIPLFYPISYSFLLIIWSTLFRADSLLNAISSLAKARPTIPKSSNWWHSELKTRRSQDWMQQFRVCLGRTESKDRGEDVGGNGEGRQHGYGAVFPFPSFLISCQYCFSIFSMVFPPFC